MTGGRGAHTARPLGTYAPASTVEAMRADIFT